MKVIYNYFEEVSESDFALFVPFLSISIIIIWVTKEKQQQWTKKWNLHHRPSIPRTILTDLPGTNPTTQTLFSQKPKISRMLGSLRVRSSTINHSIQKCTRHFSSSKASTTNSTAKANINPKYGKTRSGTGSGSSGGASGDSSMIPRGPVSWASLGLVAVAAASAVGYYQIERERRLENAMGKIVSPKYCWY